MTARPIRVYLDYESESTRSKWEDLIHVRVAEPFLDEPRLDIGGT